MYLFEKIKKSDPNYFIPVICKNGLYPGNVFEFEITLIFRNEIILYRIPSP